MSMRFGLFMFIAILGGCANQERIRAQEATIDDRKCRSYGVQPGTEPYFQCRMSLGQQRTLLEATEENNRQGAYGAMMGAGSRMMGR